MSAASDPSQSDVRPTWDYEGRVIEALQAADGRTHRLIEAVEEAITALEHANARQLRDGVAFEVRVHLRAAVNEARIV